jgi:hypothetical protein
LSMIFLRKTGIHFSGSCSSIQDMDGRDKPGHGGECDMVSA